MSAQRFHRMRILAAITMGMSLAAVLAAQTPNVDWPSFNRTHTSDRYAPLDQINRTTVSKLKQLCVFDFNVDTNFQTGPLVIGRTLYATTDKEIVAIDAETCQQKWRVREEGPSVGLAVNRGAAHLDGRLFRGTGEGDVIAYDAATGKKLWTTRIASREKGESVPSAPIAWNGLVFVGTAGSDNYGVQGRMYALEAQTGKVAWETYMVPTDAPQPGNEKMQAQARATWGNAGDVPITGGGTWSTYTLDAERGLLYVPVGNPGP
ncbi:MAG TPA: PQQ-binding-like beta-propeller repeat protein, partial [Vicinamibacterales bacterium]